MENREHDEGESTFLPSEKRGIPWAERISTAAIAESYSRVQLIPAVHLRYSGQSDSFQWL